MTERRLRSRLYGADMDENFVAYLLSQRTRVRNRLAALRSGQSWTSEMHKDEPVDTTAQTLGALEDNLEEVDRLLNAAGVPPETENPSDANR